MPEIQRRKTVTVKVGQVRVGSDVPVVVQSMTNTDTADVPGTIQQVAALATAGSELVRVTVNNDAAAKAVPFIVEGLAKLSASCSAPCGRTLTANLPHFRTASCIAARWLTQTKSSSGSIDNEQTALAVMPERVPATDVVMTETAVARCAMASRKSCLRSPVISALTC